MHTQPLWSCPCSLGKEEVPFRAFLSFKLHTYIQFLSYRYRIPPCILLLFALSSLGNVICLLSDPWKVQGPTLPHFLLQIKMLTDRKRELEHRLSAMMEENDLLQGTVEELQDRVLILERQSHDKDLQVRRQQQDREEGGNGVKDMVWGKLTRKIISPNIFTMFLILVLINLLFVSFWSLNSVQ